MNWEYEGKGENEVGLEGVEIMVGGRNVLEDWVESKGKVGGEDKIGGLRNRRE